MNRLRSLALVSMATVLPLATVSAQAVTPRQRAVLNIIDRSGDDVISPEELEQFLREAIRSRAAQAGLEMKPNTQAFDAYVRQLRTSALNHSSADGNDTISAEEIAQLETTPLPSPLAGSMKDLLPKDAPKPKPAPSWTDHLEDWLDIRNSFLDEQSIGKPAKLTLTRYASDDETIDAGKPRHVWSIDGSAILDGFIEWEPARNLFLRPVFGYEMHVNSSKLEADHVVHRVGLETHFLRDAADVIQSHRLRATFDYSTDRSYAARAFGATVEYTPNATTLGIGRYLGGGQTFDFRWRPYVGIVWAEVQNPGDVKAYKELPNFTHEFVRVTGEVRLTERGRITPEYTLWHGGRTDASGSEHHWQSLATVDHRWILSMSNGNERASIDFAWTVGRDSPGFEKAKNLELALAFKF